MTATISRKDFEMSFLTTGHYFRRICFMSIYDYKALKCIKSKEILYVDKLVNILLQNKKKLSAFFK